MYQKNSGQIVDHLYLNVVKLISGQKLYQKNLVPTEYSLYLIIATEHRTMIAVHSWAIYKLYFDEQNKIPDPERFFRNIC